MYATYNYYSRLLSPGINCMTCMCTFCGKNSPFPFHWKVSRQCLQLEVCSEPTLRFAYVTCITEMKSEFWKSFIYFQIRTTNLTDTKRGMCTTQTTDRQKMMHKSPPCKLHKCAQLQSVKI